MTLEETLKSYDLNDKEIKEICAIIKHIYEHKEFQKRLTKDFLHHGEKTLGMHILEDTIKTYKLAQKYLKKDKNFRLDLAIKIAMFHDLYTMPWQNNEFAKYNKFRNKHGFRHPVEAAINAYTWFCDDFKDILDAKIIIDGIIHHMYPLPAIVIDNKIVNSRELNNFKLFKKMPENMQDLIFTSTARCKFLNLSWCKSKYLEGKIMARADKIASLKQFNNIYSVMALVTGKNKSLRK